MKKLTCARRRTGWRTRVQFWGLIGALSIGVPAAHSRLLSDDEDRLPTTRPVIRAGQPCRVHVYHRGQWQQVVVWLDTVGETLAGLGIEVGPEDSVVPHPDVPLAHGMKIRVVQVETVRSIETTEIPMETTFRLDPSLRGRTRVVRPGQTGLFQRDVEETYHDGRLVRALTLTEGRVREPEGKIVAVGRKELVPSRGLTARRSFVAEASAYTPYPRGGSRTGHTANGMKAGYGLVAVDPRFIKMGTRLYIEGYGYALAADRGSAIKGNRIDLCFETRSEALRFGRRKVRVFVLD